MAYQDHVCIKGGHGMMGGSVAALGGRKNRGLWTVVHVGWLLNMEGSMGA